MWQDMCRVLDLSRLVDDPRFLTVPDRNGHRADLIALLDAAFLKKDAAEWVTLLRDTGVPVGAINTVDKALAEPQVVQRGMVLQLEGDEPEQRARVAGNPIKQANYKRNAHRFPPRLGQDTDDVLRNTLGYDPEKVAHLVQSRAVSTQDALTASRKPATRKT